jgi:hypothetical protein
MCIIISVYNSLFTSVGVSTSVFFDFPFDAFAGFVGVSVVGAAGVAARKIYIHIYINTYECNLLFHLFVY